MYLDKSDQKKRTKISIVTPCFNEIGNLEELCQRVREAVEDMNVDFEHIIIDNCSTDGSVATLRQLAREHRHLKVILNRRNFGHLRSPYHALMQATGDVAIILASDLQDPPETIPKLFQEWADGSDVVFLVRTSSDEKRTKQGLRRIFYRTLAKSTTTTIIQDAHGSGLYSRQCIEYLRQLPEPYPFLRGLVAEGGFKIGKVGFHQPLRRVGRSSNGLRNLYDAGILGFITHSRTPLRLTMLAALSFGLVSFVLALYYFIRKLIAWNSFNLGLAPLTVGLFLAVSVQLFFLAVIAEYIGDLHTRLRSQPHVVESERINFEES